MSKKGLEKSIEEAANSFALQIVSAVKSATLQELIELQGTAAPALKPGRKPGVKYARKPGRKPGPTPLGRVARVTRRIRRNYPKCAYTGCTKNRFPRGEGFCGEHWRMWKAGKIKDAASYQK